MSWGTFAARSLMNHHVGLSGDPSHWKVLGLTSREGSSQHKSLKSAFKAKYSGQRTKDEMSRDIVTLKREHATAIDPIVAANLKMKIRAMKSAQKSILKANGFYKLSATAYAPGQYFDPRTSHFIDPIPSNMTESPAALPTDTPSLPASDLTTPTIGDTINADTEPKYYAAVPDPKQSLLAPAIPSSRTGMTMWDTIQSVTKGNTTLLIAGAGLLAYLIFFRKK